MLVLALFASMRLFQLTRTEAAFEVLGMEVPHATLWAAALFAAFGAVVFLFTFGPSTGMKGLDSATHGLIDLLVETEVELNKVSWPNAETMTRSTSAVLVSIAILGAFLFCVGILVTKAMEALGVLPR